MDKSSVVVKNEEYVTLCCNKATAEGPSSDVVWMKDGVEISHSVRTLVLQCVASSSHKFV